MCQHEMVFGCFRSKMNILNSSVMHIMHSFDVYSTIQHAECMEVGIVLRFNTCRSCAKSEFIFVIGRAVLLVSQLSTSYEFTPQSSGILIYTQPEGSTRLYRVRVTKG